MKRKLLAVLSVLVLLSGLGLTAFAYDVPDMTAKGSISVTMTHDGEPVSGGSLTIYRVGEICEDNGNYFFSPAGDFASCGAAFEDVQSPTLAEKLAAYAKKEKLTGTTHAVDKDGVAKFWNLEVGLYLVVQKRAARGFSTVSPFLVSVPKMTDGTYVYDVDATPKMGNLTTKPTQTTSSTTPTDEKLPQTGQLNWPVPMLAVVGMLLFAAGWLLRYGKKQEQ